MQHEALPFLTALHGLGVEESHGLVALWRLDRKETILCKSAEEAADIAASLDGVTDLYTCVCLSPEGVAADKRATANTVTSLAGFFMDFDIAGEGHKKSNLPKSVDEIHAMISEFGLRPTLFISTGHGYQGHWLLDEPLHLDDGNREIVKSEMLRWQETWKAIARSSGHTIDSVYDLARLCRIPGMANMKIAGDGARSSIVSIDDNRRYTFDQIQEYLIDESMVSQMKSDLEAVNISVGSIKEDSFHALEFALENDTKFADTWNYKRRDLDDDSPSSYDLALASIAVRLNWTDQEIANAISIFRRKHNNKPEKGMRSSYLVSTIARARAIGCGLTNEAPVIGERARPVEIKKEGQKEGADKDSDTLKSISKLVGANIIKIQKYGEDNSSWSIHVGGTNGEVIGRVFFKSTADMRSRKNFIDRFADIRIPVMIKATMWDVFMKMLILIADEVEREGTDYNGETIDWATSFCSGNNLIHVSDLSPGTSYDIRAILSGRDGSEWLCINLDKMAQYLELSVGKITQVDLRARMNHIGFNSKKIQIGGTNGAFKVLFSAKAEEAIRMGIISMEQLTEWRQMKQDIAANM